MSTICGHFALALANLSDDEPVIMHGWMTAADTKKDEVRNLL